MATNATGLKAAVPVIKGVAKAGFGYIAGFIRKVSRGVSGFTDEGERSIAEFLESLGRNVSKNPLEGLAGVGRQGDAFVDGVKHEFKTLSPGAGSNTIKNVVNNSIRKGGQARNIVIDSRGSGLSRELAERGLGRAIGISRGKVDNITIIGDDYFINRAVGN